jgi:hypothetical protein
LYGDVNVGARSSGEEWLPGRLPDGWFNSIAGVRVDGTSLEPVARNGQIVLIEILDARTQLRNDMLACVSLLDNGDVIKRCFVQGRHCFLCAVNPVEREIPFAVELDAIVRAYPLKGVLFEAGEGSERET